MICDRGFETRTTNDSGWHARLGCESSCVTTLHSGEITPQSWRNLEAFRTRRRALNRRGLDAKEFRPTRQQVDPWGDAQLSAEATIQTIYGAFIEGELEFRSTSREGSMTCTSTAARGFCTTNAGEPFERIYFGLQRTGSHSTIQGDSKTGRVSEDSLLAAVLAYGGTVRAAASIIVVCLIVGTIIYIRPGPVCSL